MADLHRDRRHAAGFGVGRSVAPARSYARGPRGGLHLVQSRSSGLRIWSGDCGHGHDRPDPWAGAAPVRVVGRVLRRSGASFARRAAAVSAAVALVFLSVVTFASAVSGQDSQGHDDHSGHGNMAAPAATPEQRAAAAKLLAEVRAGVAPYADFSTARTAGYRQVTPWRYLTWGPAHYQNFAYTRDGVTLDPSRPEDLVFMRRPRGPVVLIGAMFLAPKGAGPRPGGPLTEWHTHDNLCVTATGTVALAKGPGQCPAGSFFIC